MGLYLSGGQTVPGPQTELAALLPAVMTEHGSHARLDSRSFEQ